MVWLSRKNPVLLIIERQCLLDRPQHRKGCRHLGTGYVSVVLRHSDGSENADDGNNDHERDEGEALLFNHCLLFCLRTVETFSVAGVYVYVVDPAAASRIRMAGPGCDYA